MAEALSIVLFGIGNEFRGDDGAGLHILRALAAEALPDVTYREVSGEGTALMSAWQDADAVLLIDAVKSGAPPGTCFRFDVHREALPTHFFHYSTHAFGVAEAVEMARALGQLPARLLVYGIEGKSFEAGSHLSDEVARAAVDVVAQIRAELQELSGKDTRQECPADPASSKRDGL